MLARREALELGLQRKDGAGALLAAGESVSGVLGSVAAVLSVEPGYESAVAAALGAAADAVAVSSLDAAVDALHWLKKHDAGRAGLVVGSGASTNGEARATWPALPGGARYAVDLVSVSEELRLSLHRLLHRVTVVDDLATGQRIVQADHDAKTVTRDGDVLGPAWSVGGSSTAPSLLEVQAAVDEAAQRLEHATRRVHEVQQALQRADVERAQVGARVEETLSRLHESDAQLAAVVEQLSQLDRAGARRQRRGGPADAGDPHRGGGPGRQRRRARKPRGTCRCRRGSCRRPRRRARSGRARSPREPNVGSCGRPRPTPASLSGRLRSGCAPSSAERSRWTVRRHPSARPANAR